MGSLRFRSRIEINNINPYVLIDAERAARLKKAGASRYRCAPG